jgi:hypothetical protein
MKWYDLYCECLTASIKLIIFKLKNGPAPEPSGGRGRERNKEKNILLKGLCYKKEKLNILG